MAVQKVVTYGHPALRAISKNITDLRDEILEQSNLDINNWISGINNDTKKEINSKLLLIKTEKLSTEIKLPTKILL